MSIQYIGARYVPKLFESPNGGAAWVPNVAYEALTIVTYANNSYTSRIPVPASVGSPNENPHYWVSTGVYNAYVETLRQEIAGVAQELDQAEADMATLGQNIQNVNGSLNTFKKQYYRFNANTRKVLFIGDSFAQGWTPDGSSTGWPDRVISLLGLSGSTVLAHGGIGFVATNDNLNFGNIANSVANKDTYTDIVIAGGRNDAGNSIASVQAAAITAINHYKTLFPNALIHIGMICYCGEANVNTWYPYTAYKNAANETGTHYLPHTELCITNQEYMASDKRHPLTAGEKQISECIAAGLAFDDFQVMSTNTITLNTNNFSGAMYTKQTNELVNVNWSDQRAADLSIAITDGNAVDIKIGTHNLTTKTGSLHQYFPVSLMVGVDVDNVRKYINIMGQIRLEKQDVYLRFKSASPDGSGWIVGTLKVIFINTGGAVFDIWD